MKYLVLFIAFFSVTLGFTQSNYEESMTSLTGKLEEAKTAEDFTVLAGYFERTGIMHQNEWLPYYYSAYALLSAAMLDNKLDKDELAKKADLLIDKSEAISPNNSEIYCLKHLSETTKMLVNPAARWMTNGKEAQNALDKAKSLNPKNPRPYLLEGETTFNTPEAFGGGKQKALEKYETALKLFDSFKPAEKFAPNWGLDWTKEGISKSK